MATEKHAPDTCPVCGEEAIPAKAAACPDCGASWDSGWDEDAARYDGLDLPEEAFDEPDMPADRKVGPVAMALMIIGGVLALLVGVAMGLAIGHG